MFTKYVSICTVRISANLQSTTPTKVKVHFYPPLLTHLTFDCFSLSVRPLNSIELQEGSGN